MKLNRKVENNCQAIKISISEDDKEIGRVRLYVLFNELHEKPFAFMEDLFVDEENRKKGLGEKLVAAAVEEAKKNNCYKFIFTCSREELFGWYEKLGFKKVGVEFRMDLV